MLKQNDRQPPLLLRNRNDRPIAINATPLSPAAMTCFSKVAACREESADLHPVHARNVGLLPAWEHWAAQTGDEPGRPPTHCTSPPPLTRWLADPAADRTAAARSTAQPFT